MTRLLSRSQDTKKPELTEIGRVNDLGVAERTGLEPATSGVTGRRSNQLSYRSTVKKVSVRTDTLFG